jgi:hypothetical protein
LDIYCNILPVHGSINVKSPNNPRKWQMGFNSAFKWLSEHDTSIRRNMGDKRERGDCGICVPPCGSFSRNYHIEAALYHEMFVPVFELYIT